MIATRKSRKPWLDGRGRPLPAETLRDISKSWDEKIWTKYLDSIDGPIEGLQLLSSRKMRLKTEYMIHSVFDLWAEVSEQETVQKIVQQSLSILTERQRQVIESIYFEGHSIEETAAKFKLSKPTVFEHQKDALKKLRGAHAVSPNDLTSMRGSEVFNGDAPEGIDPEIYEVFLADSQRHGWNKGDFDKEGV